MVVGKTIGIRLSHGTILVELLLAMMLFLGVLWPVTRWLVRTARMDRAADIVLATHLAREHLERLRLAPTARPAPELVTLNHRPYRVTQEVVEHEGLFTLTVRVYRGAEDQPLVQVTTLTYPGEPP